MKRAPARRRPVRRERRIRSTSSKQPPVNATFVASALGADRTTDILGLLMALDRATGFLSGGYRDEPGFDQIVSHGRDALPVLLGALTADPDEPDTVNPWLIFALVDAIGVGDDGPKIAERDRGRLGPVREAFIEWGRNHGLVPGYRFVRRAEAIRRLVEAGQSVAWDRARNYEIEARLDSTFPEGRVTPEGARHWIVDDPCPFNAQWCAWGTATEAGRAYSRAYEERAKALYRLDACPQCGHKYWGRVVSETGERRANLPGPEWDGICTGCQQPMLPPPPTLPKRDDP